MTPDEELAKGCRQGDPKAQKQLFDRFSGKMLGVCARYADSIEEAEDVLQESFIKIFNRIDSYKGEGSLEGWIRRVMVNTSLDQLRKNKAFSNTVHLDMINSEPTSEDYTIEELSAKDLLKLMKTMPRGFRTVFNLYAIEGFNHKEIAAQLGITESTSKSQYSRAKMYFQKLITNTEKLV
jgi:RNA polymerase sigma-70 factor, ECF subfamily